ncbi:MAG: hypothetical protein ACI837_002963 [Crocinitomicaceae bacterium]|jgi:hypothetical protein
MQKKQLLLLLGSGITLAGLFLPILTSCESILGTDEYETTFELGYESPVYYISLFFLLFVIGFSPTAKSRRSPTVVITCTVLGGAITLTSIWLGGAGWGGTCGSNPTLLFYLLLLGHLLIVASGIAAIFFHKEKNV